MCGIFGYVGTKTNAASIVLDGLKRLEYRGYDSWGVAVVIPAKAGIQVKKRIGKIGNASVSDLPASSIAFGHTRWATHGGVTQKNAHPHLSCDKRIALIHNGIFENYEEIKKTLKHHHFVSQTDTEVIVHLVEEYAKTMPLVDAVKKAFSAMKGLNAIIVLSARQIIAIRNGSPLVIGFGNKENFIASDAAALLPYTKRVHFLLDNECAIIEKDAIAGIVPHIQTLTWKVAAAEKGNYPNFMLKEIHEQTDILSTITARASYTKSFEKYIKKSRGAYLIGCGTASYAALAGEYLFSKIAKRHINVAIASEFGYHLDFLTRDSLVIAISQSGETMDILESVKKAKAKGASILALVNAPGSSLTRESDYVIPIGAGPEKAVASTKAFTAMLAHLIILAGGSPKKAVAGVRSVLDNKTIQRIAEKLKHKEHIFAIGRGLSYPTALETALKIKEISYIHAEGLAAGELKHGPLALVTRGIPVIAFLPNDETYGANLAGAMEMKARGGYIIGVSHKLHEVFDEYIHVPDAGEATIIPNVVVAQLLAYYLTIARGLDPDMPRNLAKSVTVK